MRKRCKEDAVKWFQDLQELPHIKVPRCLVPSGESDFLLLYLFADASERTYGAVIYAWCIQSNGEMTSNIVMSKSRVAPLK